MTKIRLIAHKFFLKEPGDWRFWIAFSLVAKISIFLFQISQNRPVYMEGFIGHVGGDSDSYLIPLDNLVQTGTYSPDYRMPGYSIFYLPLVLLYSKATACNIVVVIQVILSSISVYCLALTANLNGKKNLIFHLVFYSFAISTYSSIWDSFILSESFCTSALIFSAYFFARYCTVGKVTNLVLSGGFITWVLFLRPMYAPLVLIFVLILAWHNYRTKTAIKSIAKNILFFLVPFIVIETGWVFRNYHVHRRFVFLTTSLYAPEFENSYVRELMDFVKAWGGDRTWWNPGSEMQWFGVSDHQSKIESNPPDLPDHIYTSKFNVDSLSSIRNQIKIIDSDETKPKDKLILTGIVKDRLSRFAQSIIDEKPFLYYVKGPLILLKRFLVHSGTYNLFNQSYANLGPFTRSIKVFYSLFYWATLTFGLMGLLVSHRLWSDARIILLGFILLYGTLLFPFFLRQIEYRYFVPAYPFLQIFSVLGFVRTCEVAKRLF
jgi:hypothetical protein